MTRFIQFGSIFTLLLGATLSARGFYVWNTCGYDCGVFSIGSGLSATVAMLVGVLLFAISAISLLALVVSRDSDN